MRRASRQICGGLCPVAQRAGAFALFLSLSVSVCARPRHSACVPARGTRPLCAAFVKLRQCAKMQSRRAVTKVREQRARRGEAGNATANRRASRAASSEKLPTRCAPHRIVLYTRIRAGMSSTHGAIINPIAPPPIRF